MRKIHIGVIAPYEAMLPLIDELKEEQSDLTIVAKVGDLERGVELARKMEQNGADILISRGGTAKMIRESVSLPVIDIHISGYDLLRSIMLATSHSDEKKALVGFPNITLGAASIISLLEIDMQVVTIPGASEVEPILLELKNNGYSTVLGDVITSTAAARLGINGLLIQSGQESVLESFDEARQLFKSQQKSQQVLRILRQLLDDSKQDVLLLTDEGQILFENWTRFKQQPVAKEEITLLRQQVLETNEEAVKIIEDTKKPFRIHAKLIEDRDGKIISFDFKRISKTAARSHAVRVEYPIHLPPLVAESAKLNGIKKILEEPAVVNEVLVLVGQAGTGKKSFARYLHTFHQKKGLFVHVKMDVSPPLEEIEFLPNTTLFLEFNETPNLKLINKTHDLLEFIEKNKIQLIFSFPVMNTRLAEKLNLQEALKVKVPTLADRRDDIEYLVRQFLTEFHQTLGTRPIKVRNDAMEELTRYSWPGNLIELKEYVKKLALLEKDYVIEKKTLEKVPFTPEFHQTNDRISLDKNDTLKAIEKKIIEQVLTEENFNQTKAANRLGMNRATLWRKLKN